MGQSVSSTFKESVVWSERRDLDENSASNFDDELEQQQHQAQQQQHDGSRPCAIPVELCAAYDGAAKRPERATGGAAGFDLYAAEDVRLPPSSESGGAGTIVTTGLRIVLDCDSVQSRISPDTVLFGDVRGQPSLARQGIRVFQGTIDADDRSEVGVLMFNDTPHAFDIKKGDRIAKLLIGLALLPRFVEVTTNVAASAAAQRQQADYESERGEGRAGASSLAAPSEIVIEPSAAAGALSANDDE